MDFTKVKANLEKLGYTVSCFDTAREAAEYLDSAIDNTTVGIGGSLTIEQMGIYDKLASHNHVFWHWRVPEDSSTAEACQKAACADVYLSSANGLSETGEIINIDGNGNRVAATIYGHRKVYFILGENKLAEKFCYGNASCQKHCRTFKCQAFEEKTPCADKADRCHNCQSPERICRALSVLWVMPSSAKYEVILIHENLGY